MTDLQTASLDPGGGNISPKRTFLKKYLEMIRSFGPQANISILLSEALYDPRNTKPKTKKEQMSDYPPRP